MSEDKSEAPTARDVAEFMLELLHHPGRELLPQHEAVTLISERFGELFLTRGRITPGINPRVRREFEKLTEGSVVWSNYLKAWRWRRPSDPPNSRVVR